MLLSKLSEGSGIDLSTASIRERLPEAWQERIGPGYRRVKREVQWRRQGRSLRMTASAQSLAHTVVSHRTVMLRALAGVDMQLQRNKVTNLMLAVECLDGLVLRPGEVFSFWKHVGRPTAERGFLEGVVLGNGEFTAGVGGGLCQLTNLIYWMTIHTDLTITERWRHGYDVFPDSNRTLPFASGATCAWPALDLQICNDTSHTWRLVLNVGRIDLEGAWQCDAAPTRKYRVYEANHVITNDAPGVYMRRNILRRKAFDVAGVELFDEMVCHNHARMMYDPLLGAGPVKLALEAPSAADIAPPQ
ncbi:VanW family protein [Yimella sp. cx-573]|nr:VanW family protein [Yimella sp. cx-573]